jgi:hypothetical protein
MWCPNNLGYPRRSVTHDHGQVNAGLLAAGRSDLVDHGDEADLVAEMRNGAGIDSIERPVAVGVVTVLSGSVARRAAVLDPRHVRAREQHQRPSEPGSVVGTDDPTAPVYAGDQTPAGILFQDVAISSDGYAAVTGYQTSMGVLVLLVRKFAN